RAGFGHPVALEHRRAERFFEARHDLRIESSRSGPDVPQLRRFRDVAEFVDALEYRVMDRRRRRIPGWPQHTHLPEKRWYVEFPRADDAGPVDERHDQG